MKPSMRPPSRRCTHFSDAAGAGPETRDAHENLVRSVLQEAQDAGDSARRHRGEMIRASSLLGRMNRVTEYGNRRGGPLSPGQIGRLLAAIFLTGVAKQWDAVLALFASGKNAVTRSLSDAIPIPAGILADHFRLHLPPTFFGRRDVLVPIVPMYFFIRAIAGQVVFSTRATQWPANCNDRLQRGNLIQRLHPVFAGFGFGHSEIDVDRKPPIRPPPPL